MSLWFLRISSLVVGAVCFGIAAATFKGTSSSMSPTNTVGLFITYLVFPCVCVLIYFISQMLLVVRTLDDRWVSKKFFLHPLKAISLGRGN